MAVKRAILLLGQSNAGGIAASSELTNPAASGYYPSLAGPSAVAQIWRDMPIVNRAFEALNPGVNTLLDDAGASIAVFGPETKLGDALGKYYGEQVYIIKLTRGTTPLGNTTTVWDATNPTLPFRPTIVGVPAQPPGQSAASVRQQFTWSWYANDMAGQLLYTVQRAAAWLAANGGHTLKVETVYWLQGESDAAYPELADSYESNLRNFVTGLRSWLISSGYTGGVTSPSSIQFVAGKIKANVLTQQKGTASVDKVRNALNTVGIGDPGYKIFDCDPFGLVDGIHYTGLGFHQIGQAFFDAWKNASTITSVVAPLFLPSKAQLESALRLSGVPDTKDAQVQIDTAIAAARVSFFRSLGSTRIAALQATPLTYQPTSQPEYERLLAADTEIKMVRLELMPVLRILFLDSSATLHEEWNQAPVAAMQGKNLAAEMARLQNEIVQALTLLSGTTGFTDGGEIGLSSIMADTPWIPGSSIFSSIQ